MEPCKHASHSTETEIKERADVIETLMKNRLYDSKEVCKLLGVSLQSLRRAIAIGNIKTVRVGKFLRITSEEIERIMHGDSALLTVEEAAAMLNVSTATIRGLIKIGKIKGFRLANAGPFKIPKSEVERIVNKGI